MKKLFTAIAALIMTISTFAACGNVAESEPAAATTQSASVTTTTAEPEVATTEPVTTPKATEVTTTSEAVISVDFTTPEVTAPPETVITTTTATTTVTTTTSVTTTTKKKTTTTAKKKTTTTAKKTTTTAKKTTTTPKQTTTAPKKTTTTTTAAARDWKPMRSDEIEKLSEAEQNAYWDWYYERLEDPDDEELINWHIQEAFRLTNEERARYGLEPYILDPIITKAAMIRAKELHVYASHTRPDGRSFATAIIDAGGTWELAGACGENWCGSGTPESAIGAWIDSPGHHANLLGDYTRVGIGYYNEAWVMIFCTPDWEMQWE